MAFTFLCLIGLGSLLRDFYRVTTLKTHTPLLEFQGSNTYPKIRLIKKAPRKWGPHAWVPIHHISKFALGAIVVSEDGAFYHHKGYDTEQIKKAIKINLRRGRFARGASTITQQVVRNIFLHKKKNLWRKTKEILMAIVLEKTLSKKKILEIYLNIAEWGVGIYGIGVASQFYFRKHPSELTAKEGAFLAMLLPSPKRYSRIIRSRGLTHYSYQKINSILQKMTKAQYLTQEGYNREKSRPLILN